MVELSLQPAGTCRTIRVGRRSAPSRLSRDKTCTDRIVLRSFCQEARLGADFVVEAPSPPGTMSAVRPEPSGDGRRPPAWRNWQRTCLVNRWLGVRVPSSAQSYPQPERPNRRSGTVARFVRATIRVSLTLIAYRRSALSAANARREISHRGCHSRWSILDRRSFYQLRQPLHGEVRHVGPRRRVPARFPRPARHGEISQPGSHTFAMVCPGQGPASRLP